MELVMNNLSLDRSKTTDSSSAGGALKATYVAAKAIEALLSSRKLKRGPDNHSEQTLNVLAEVVKSEIDPVVFDSLLSNEIDRHLKIQFGIAFLVLTMVVTSLSYAVVILNGVFRWEVSDVAITALIIETPMQFLGLLYIVARNLFPHRGASFGDTSPRKSAKRKRNVKVPVK